MVPSGTGQKFYTGRVTSQETVTGAPLPVVVEDYRSDRAILEELSLELGRLHRRLDGYEQRYDRWQAGRRLVDVLGRAIGQLGRGPHA